MRKLFWSQRPCSLKEISEVLIPGRSLIPSFQLTSGLPTLSLILQVFLRKLFQAESVLVGSLTKRDVALSLLVGRATKRGFVSSCWKHDVKRHILFSSCWKSDKKRLRLFLFEARQEEALRHILLLEARQDLFVEVRLFCVANATRWDIWRRDHRLKVTSKPPYSYTVHALSGFEPGTHNGRSDTL